MSTYEISPADVEAEWLTPSSEGDELQKRSKGDIAKTLFMYLGAIFLLAGLGTYTGMFWDSMGAFMRVLITLGVAYILYLILIAALHEQKYPRLVLPLTMACTLFMVSGWFVLIDEVFPDGDNWRAATLFVFGTTAVHFAALMLKNNRTLFAFIALFFTYGFMHIGLDMLGVSATYIAIILGMSLFLVSTALEQGPHRILTELALFIAVCWLNGGLFDLVALWAEPNWSSVLIGINVMLTAFGLHRANRYPRLVGIGYLVGSFMFYAGLFDILENTSIELLFLAVTAAILYVCVVLQSRALLFTTVLAMLSYIGYFSAEHFADSLGWPITLMLMGLAFLGVGTVAMKLRRQI
ncbi:MAG: hypothetical protein AAF431_13665 [Pseudomonadota bacterium]